MNTLTAVADGELCPYDHEIICLSKYRKCGECPDGPECPQAPGIVCVPMAGECEGCAVTRRAKRTEVKDDVLP